ncbi:PTS sugar transporter subunit IIC [Celerinatantimonas sp. MCCC 1A17872]|uniref:PTS sugar transporter subunit IIC n=1 Tax=Celerinatantimonas sp. MCCC 1A17872 TaxID=3177514 RepID=UPI0038CB3EC8
MNEAWLRLFANAVEEYIAPIAKVLSQSNHITAMRDSFQLSMPFIIVGSLFIPFLYPPVTANSTDGWMQIWYQFSQNYRPLLLPPYQITFGVISLTIAFGASASLAKQYQMPQRLCGLTSCMAFLLLIGLFNHSSQAYQYLGSTGMFTALFASFYSVEMIRLCQRLGWIIQLPEEVPQITQRGFALIIPLLLIMVSLTIFNELIFQYTGAIFPKLVEQVFQPLVIASDSLPAIIISLMVCSLLWFIGIHGALLVTGIMNPFWMTNLSTNQLALAAGQVPPHIFLQAFWDYYLLIGGVGSTLPLVFMALRSRSRQLRSVGKVGVIPSLFNINEPILFGFPIIMNPLFFLPFLFVPVINACIAWYLTQIGWLSRFVAMLPWSTPGPIGAAWAANGSLNNACMSLLAIVLSWLIYRPFFKVHEKLLLEQESNRSLSQNQSENTQHL